jgi:hypothetical protein
MDMPDYPAIAAILQASMQAFPKPVPPATAHLLPMQVIAPLAHNVILPATGTPISITPVLAVGVASTITVQLAATAILKTILQRPVPSATIAINQEIEMGNHEDAPVCRSIGRNNVKKRAK